MSLDGPETVIPLHGTFARPNSENLQWYEPSDGGEPEASFIARLDKCLAQKGSSARCWAHCDGKRDRIFSWSGDNTWIARSEASRRLAVLVKELLLEAWRVHIVARSHGGVVLLEALTLMQESGWANARVETWSGGNLN
jgi:hypothetical protein